MKMWKNYSCCGFDGSFIDFGGGFLVLIYNALLGRVAGDY